MANGHKNGHIGEGGERARRMKIRVMLVRESRPKSRSIDSPEAAFTFLFPKMRRLDREYLFRIDLDARNQMIGYEICSIGSLSASLVHPREIFKGAILANAAAIIIGHNHPSGDCSPSAEDKDVTARIKQAGNILGITLIDHLIVAGKQFYSFKSHDLI